MTDLTIERRLERAVINRKGSLVWSSGYGESLTAYLRGTSWRYVVHRDGETIWSDGSYSSRSDAAFHAMKRILGT